MSFTTLSFTSPDTIRIPLQDSISLKIKRDSIATACVSFVQDGVEVNVPDDVIVKNRTYNEIITPVYNTQNFILGWTCSYEVYSGGKLIVSLVNKRDWDPDCIFMSPEQREWSVYIEK
jgi:hypothetical protein